MSENEMLNRRILAVLFANRKIILYLCRAFQKMQSWITEIMDSTRKTP